MREPQPVKTLWTSSTGCRMGMISQSTVAPETMTLACTSFLTMWTTTGGFTGISGEPSCSGARSPSRPLAGRCGVIGWWITLSALGSASGSLKPTGSMSPIEGSGVHSRLPNSWNLGIDQWFARTRPRLLYEPVTEWLLYIINPQSTF